MLSEKLKEKICKIKKLKLENFLDNYFIHKTFYINYKSPQRILSSPNKEQNYNNKIFLSRLRNKNVKIFKTKSKSTNRILGLNSDYLFFNPHVTRMMKGGVDSTEYDSTKYTLSKKEEIKKTQSKKYFGISGDTPLINTGTLSDLYSTTNVASKTLSKINSFSERNIFQRTKNQNFEISENDRKIAEEFFLDSFRNKNLKMFTKENKKNFYDKYNINNKLTFEEESKINKIIDRNKINNLNLYPIFKSINSDDSFDLTTHTVALDRQYKNPFNSCKKMKIKKQMMKVIEDLNINFQCEKFQEEYNTICELNIQANRMPNIKVIPKKKLKIFKGFNAEQYLKKLEQYEYSFEEKDKKKSKKEKNQIYLFRKPQTIYARGIDLQEVELKVEYVPTIYHPEVRTKTAICFNEEKGKIYLYGGLEGRKMADLWRFNFSQVKMGWHKLYEPKKDSDFENEPFPRFGHTLHFYNKKLYLIGGEFNDWKNNILKEGIMCVYDLKSKMWDMMKYNYDIKWYTKKIEEKRRTLKHRILSYHEITEFIENKKNKNNGNRNSIFDIDINNKETNFITKIKENKLEQKQLSTNNLISKNNSKIRNTNKLQLNKEHIKLFKAIKSTNDLIDNNKTNKETKLDSKESNKDIYPELRRYHISLLIGTHIFLYGGETPFKKVLNDCWIYDLINQKWSLV